MLHRNVLVCSVLSLLLALSACDDKRPAGQGSATSLIVRGLLTRSAGIGGETTGWVLVLDQPVEIEGQKLNLLEVEFDPARWPLQEDTQVEATGRLAFRTGLERGRYPVLLLDRIVVLRKSSQ